jgi:nicotinate-nucleotide adenylyltransferase
MVALAIAPFDGFRASTIEVDAPEKPYTIDTLRKMHETFPGGQFVFIMGTDMYRDFETWRDYRKLFTLTHLAVVNRPGFEFRDDLAAHRTIAGGEVVALTEKPEVFYLPFVEQPVSSTAIRERLKNGSEVRACVPPAVWSYIERNKLYS